MKAELRPLSRGRGARLYLRATSRAEVVVAGCVYGRPRKIARASLELRRAPSTWPQFRDLAIQSGVDILVPRDTPVITMNV